MEIVEKLNLSQNTKGKNLNEQVKALVVQVGREMTLLLI
jgi:hypothetical protein